MSIHCYLNSDATLVTIERRAFDKSNNKSIVEQVGKFDITKSKHLPADTSPEILQKVQPFIDEQLTSIENAFAENAACGLYGGMPVVARSTRYNAQFKDMKGFRTPAPKGHFLGVIQGARRFDMFSMNTLSNEVIEQRMERGTLGAALAGEIISNEIRVILEQNAITEDMRGVDCMEPHRAAELIHLVEMVKQFVKLCRTDYKELHDIARDDIAEAMQRIAESPSTASFGLKRKIDHGETRANRLRRKKEDAELEAKHEQRLEKAETAKPEPVSEKTKAQGLAAFILKNDIGEKDKVVEQKQEEKAGEGEMSFGTQPQII